MKTRFKSRFLKPFICKRTKKVGWVEISDSTARDKVRHALSVKAKATDKEPDTDQGSSGEHQHQKAKLVKDTSDTSIILAQAEDSLRRMTLHENDSTTAPNVFCEQPLMLHVLNTPVDNSSTFPGSCGHAAAKAPTFHSDDSVNTIQMYNEHSWIRRLFLLPIDKVIGDTSWDEVSGMAS
jgi:hypothetical protein